MLLALLGACSSTERAGTVVHEADSAGVRVVVYDALPDVPALTADSAPLVVLGADPEFERVAGASFLADGGILVADVLAARLHFYDANGAVRHVVGRAGAGPLEFRNLDWARPYGADSIVTYDLALRRLMWLDTSARLGRVETLRPTGEGNAEAAGLLANGDIIAISQGGVLTPDVPAGIHTLPLTLWRYDPGGESMGAIARGLAGEQWVKVESPSVLMPRAFTSSTLITVGADEVHFADGARGTVESIGPEGRLIRRVTLPLLGAPVTPERIAIYRRQRLAATQQRGSPEQVTRQTAVLDAMTYPERFPALRRLFVDRDGRLWVERYQPAATSSQEYIVLDHGGRIIAQVTGPDGGIVLDAADDHILVRWRDPDDRDQVRVYQISPPILR